MVVDLVGRAVLLDAAVVHHDDAVGDLHRLVLVVRDEHARHVHLVVQPAQPAAQLLAHLRVERAERLVEQQHLRLDRERARERDALALAARELVRVAVGDPVELHELQQLHDLRADLLLVGPRRLRPHAQAERDVLEDRSCGRTARSAGTRSRPGARARRCSSRPRRGTARCRASGTSSPAMMRSSVVLPEPEGPSSATSSPAGMSRFRLSQTTVSPKRLLQVADFDAHSDLPLGAARFNCAFTRCSTTNFSTSVTSASPASSDATANAAANWYSL